MAAKLHGEPSTSAKPKPAVDSTDKGLQSQSLHALDSTDSAASKPAGAGAKGGRLEVNSLQDAKLVADKRKANLEAKKMDKCPVCDSQHTYERVWDNVQPPVKMRLLSTHLTTCAKFLALSAEAKLAAVVGNAACLQCAAWDHTAAQVSWGQTSKGPQVQRPSQWQGVRRSAWQVVP